MKAKQKLESLIESKVRKVLNEEKSINPDMSKLYTKYGSELAEKFRWIPLDITGAYLEALTDANHHSARKQLTPILNKIYGVNFDDI